MERHDPELVADERTMLEQFLDYHRATFIGKVSGLTKEQLAQSIPTSPMTLAGLIKHLALVEDSWFQEDVLGLENVEPWLSAPFDSDPDWEWHSAVDDEPADLLELYSVACDRSRAAASTAASLDVESVGTSRHTGEHYSLRWIMLHMIEETARHNGHADLLREAIDGAIGE